MYVVVVAIVVFGFCVFCLSYADFDLFNKQKAPKYKKPQEETLPSSSSDFVRLPNCPKSICPPGPVPAPVLELAFGLALSPFGFAYGNNSIMHNKDAE